ncbi:MAG TPA: CDP-alcohol phosphatidyltransferase family protein, partial [Streptomyces sp.]|nr:CDP-alcohol phosphatidyltransferase family protein [Streptomyces sp.]
LLRDNPGADLEQDMAAAEAVPAGGVTLAAPSQQRQIIDLNQEFRHRFPAYLRMRSFLLRHRIRTHLVSGIEFQMAVFIIGPLFDAVFPVTLVSGGLLLGFELAIVYKLLLSTRDFTRTIDTFEGEPARTSLVDLAVAHSTPRPAVDTPEETVG